MGLRYLQVHKSIQCGFNDTHFVIDYFIMPFLGEFVEPFFSVIGPVNFSMISLKLASIALSVQRVMSKIRSSPSIRAVLLNRSCFFLLSGF